MNFTPLIRASRKAWRIITVPLAFTIALALYTIAFLPIIFVFVFGYLRGKRLPSQA